jgi:hypothetical protein
VNAEGLERSVGLVSAVVCPSSSAPGGAILM